MFAWFGRKSAPETRPFVPAWLHGESEAGGFVRAVDGMRVLDRSTGHHVTRSHGIWEIGISRVAEIRVDGQTVLRQRQAAIAEPGGGAIVDLECRTAVAAILGAMRAHGLID